MRNPTEPTLTLGAYLRELRGKRSRPPVAKAAGLSVRTVLGVEQGEVMPTVDTLCKLLDVLGADDSQRLRALELAGTAP